MNSFFSFKNLSDLLEFLDKNSKDSLILAGGTDLILKIQQKNIENKNILDITKIDSLKRIEEIDEYIHIGALVSFEDIKQSLLIEENLPILHEAASLMAAVQIRNRATIGGNIVNLSPAADSIPPLLALSAKVEIMSLNEKRIIPLHEFIQGGKVNLNKGEILTTIIVKKLSPSHHSKFIKIGRRKALSISRLSISIVCNLNDIIVEDIKVVPGAVLPYPQEMIKTQQFLLNKPLTDEVIQQSADILQKEVISITGNRWSMPYKKVVIVNLFKRILKAFSQIEGGSYVN